MAINKGNIWSEDDINILKQYFADYSNEYIANLLGRTVNSIRNIARDLGLKKQGKKKFSKIITLEQRNNLINNHKNYCNKCNQIKDLTLFSKDNKLTTGYRNICKQCRLDKFNENKKKKTPNAQCYICGKEFYKDTSNLKNDKLHFCSNKCKSKWRSNKFKEININKPKYTKLQEIYVIKYINDGLSYSEIEDNTGLRIHQIIGICNKNNLIYVGKNKNKSELHRKLLNLLTILFPKTNFKDEYYIQETKQYIDIFDLDNKIAYEANGIQHYIQKGTWNRNDKDFKLQQERDKRKADWCKQNNIPLVIIRYDEDITNKLIINKLKEQGINYEDIYKKISSF